MRQKMRQKITTVRTMGTPRAQSVRFREISSNEAGSGMPGSVIGSSVQSRDGLVEGFLHRGQCQRQGGTRLGRVSQVLMKQDVE